MKDIIWIRLALPKDFSLQVDRMLIDMKEKGVKKTKANKIVELARVGFLNEIIKN
jgi:hypothetical protein